MEGHITVDGKEEALNAAILSIHRISLYGLSVNIIISKRN
jgi:hypothetical protein